MIVEITPQSIITTGAVITALTAIVAIIFKMVRWVDHQKEQDAMYEDLKTQHDNDIDALKKSEAADIADIKNEQLILTHGILACLKGLKEKGCNGPVTEAIDMIEMHLNQKAHK